MKDERELEIQYQFLEEAQDYLSTLETALLGIATRGIELERIKVALRATHSIKGGAAMMGFSTMSHLAHRLEDSLKVLKMQRDWLEVDPELERSLLIAVGHLGQVIVADRQALSAGHFPLDSHWLETQIMPVFDQLHARLGDPDEEDAQSILSATEGQDILPILFETEIESCLQQLETALDTHDPQLEQELATLAQELIGLGEMLQLDAFVQLCESIQLHLAAAPTDGIESIARRAVQSWRRSQALVLSKRLDLLPTMLDGAGLVGLDLAQPELMVEGAEAVGAAEPLAAETIAEAITETVTAETISKTVTAETVASETITAAEFTVEPDWQEQPAVFSEAEPATASVKEATAANFAASGAESKASAVPPKEPENSVRVPVKQLDQLNDLFGELLIARSGVNLNLSRLRSLLHTLSDRIEVLERSNRQLRDAYDVRSSVSELDWGRTGFALPSARDFSSDTFSSDSFSSNIFSSDTFSENAAADLAAAPGAFDALEMDRYDETHLLSQEVMETIVQIQEVHSDLELTLEDMDVATRELNKTTQHLQGKLGRIRMRPLSDLVDRFPRAVREMSLQYGKPVELQIDGETTLLDRNILEALNEPLMHLIRNAFDHGIEPSNIRSRQGKPEQGLIKIQAAHQNNRTLITIRDDGAGIPIDKVRARAAQIGLDPVLLAAATDEELVSLIFEPGFSTSEQVTALSGRGVGMDVVRDRLKQIQGDITVNTQAGIGTSFTLSLPFTLSVTRVLLAECKGMPLAFPIDVIEETIVLQPGEIMQTVTSEAFARHDKIVQFVRLSQWLTFHRPRQFDDLDTATAISVPTVLMIKQGDRPIGLEVDRCWGEQEVAVRRVEGGLPLPPGFANCTILGDGRVVPLVSIAELLHWISSCQRTQKTEPAPASLPPGVSLQTPAEPAIEPAARTAPRRPTVLIVDDSINVRRFLALTLQKAGYQVAQAKDGQDAIDKLVAGLAIEAVICDIEMPRLDGYGFLARFKSDPTFNRVPVAMLTSRSSAKHRRMAVNLGANAYFSKPYNEQVLLQTLERMVMGNR